MATLIIALNPSIDAEWRVADVVWEEKNNVQSERRWAGGKGINVARWLRHLGGRAELLLPLGGMPGSDLAGYLRKEQIKTRMLALRESTRINVIVTTSTGRQLRFNPLGPKLRAVEWRNFLAIVARKLKRTKLLVLSGSLPRGLRPSAYAQLIELARSTGAKAILDCDGAPFAAGVLAGPFLVKPNEHELAQWWGRPIRREAELLRAARALSERTGGWVLVSRGSEKSLLLNLAAGYQEFRAPRQVKPVNTVGAGDAMLAGVIRQIQAGEAPSNWLRSGLASGTQATQLEPGLVSGP